MRNRADRAMPVLFSLPVLLWASVAVAHGDSAPVHPGNLWHHWTFDRWALAPLALAVMFYAVGVIRLWRRAGIGRGISHAAVLAYATGVLLLIIALVTPLDPLAETLFSAHMVQHALLIAIAPPLLLTGRPDVAFAWALPRYLSQGLSRPAWLRSFGRGASWLIRPLPAAVLHGCVLWLWHVPTLFTAALAYTSLHRLEHVSFFVTALLFWMSLMRASRSLTTVPAGIAATFLILIQGGFLSALITFAPQPLYSWYDQRTFAWGLSLLEDQQLAGLIMGAPLTLIYLLASTALAAKLLSPSQELRRRGTARPAFDC